MTYRQISYAERAKSVSHPLSKALYEIMKEKETALCLAVDFIKKKQLLALADLLGPQICLLKTHIDIVEDFDQDLIVSLKKLANKHRFLIFEDRKFADIGNTVCLQYQRGIYRIHSWADLINAHPLVGPGMIEGLKQVADSHDQSRGLLLLAQMSAKGNLAKGEYTQNALEMARKYKDFVLGFIARERLDDSIDFLHMMPGIDLERSGDNLGQHYLSPKKALEEKGADIIIVGRGIIAAQDPLKEAMRYRKESWLWRPGKTVSVST